MQAPHACTRARWHVLARVCSAPAACGSMWQHVAHVAACGSMWWHVACVCSAPLAACVACAPLVVCISQLDRGEARAERGSRREEEGQGHLAESFFAIFELLVGNLELLALLVHFGLEVFELGFARLELLLFLLDGQFGFGQIL